MAMPTRPAYLFTPIANPTITTASSTRPMVARNVTAIIHSPERSAMLCRYPSKLCDMMRSEKRGGGLHRFCAYHRERANINQRRVDHRRRLRKKGLPVPPLERAPSHWQHSGDESDSASPMRVKKEEERQDRADDEQRRQQEDDLFDAIDATQPLLPDFSENDLNELMELLDHVDTEPSMFSIKEEPVDDQRV